MKRKEKEICDECRKLTTYKYKLVEHEHIIGNKKYKFKTTCAICDNCGNEIGFPELIDVNALEISEQYREAEGLIQNYEIEKLMKTYNIGKTPLSFALGFGEVTINRYFSGYYPSKEYSDKIKKALSNPKFMLKCLNENREKIGEVAYNKAKIEVDKIRKLFNSMSREMTLTVARILDNDPTPLSLEKMLYYIQNIYMLKYNKPLFDEKCLAWKHGPVYKNVYDVFKTFKYNSIDDERFSILKYYDDKLDDETNEIIDLVVNTFGMYNGKVLEDITHNEEPWQNIYNPSATIVELDQTIKNEDMNRYFKEVNKKYNLLTEKGINDYIKFMLKKSNK